jgi:beta-phosphoglucomutase-like phosphatase (HAD superfamily)
VVVSGEVGVIKPDPRIFELLLERFAIDPKRAVYIDDVAANVDAARPFGIPADSDEVGRAFRLMSATCSDRSRPAVPIDVGRGGGRPLVGCHLSITGC